MAGKLKILGVDVHTYLTQDAARSIAFYRDVLELPVLQLIRDQGAEFELPDGTIFGLWEPRGEFPFSTSSGIMFAVEDFAGAVETAKERGMPIFHVEETPVCWMAIGADPDGNQVVFHKRKDGTAG